MSIAIGRVDSINLSRGGVPKTSVFEAFLSDTGLDGDRQRDLRVHGGPDRAVVLYSLERIRALQREGHPITPGATGENLTVAGLDWDQIVPGTELRIGEAQFLITKYTTPCEKIRRSFLADDFMRIAQSRHPGWSRVCAKVLASGLVQIGDLVEVRPDRAERQSAAQ